MGETDNLEEAQSSHRHTDYCHPELNQAFLIRIALALYDDRQRKTQEIQALERAIAGRLVQTPYLLLLSFPGINVVSAADFAGEMGPIEHYAHAKAITGRAGLRPSRYQSDRVDKANEPRTPSDPKGRTLRKAWRSLGSPTPDTAPWGHSPDIPVWRYGDRKNERGRFVQPIKLLSNSLIAPFSDGDVHRP